MGTRFSAAVAAIALALAATPAGAISLNIVPGAPTTTVGGTFSADIVLSGLSAGFSLVGTFDIDVSFDAGLLDFGGVTFGSALGDPLLGEALTSFDSSSPGTVNLFELSFLEASGTCVFCLPPYLDELQQGDSITLASLSFNALAAGSSLIGLAVNAIGDADGAPLTIDQIGGATVEAAAPVPEPEALSLLGVGLLGLLLSRRRLTGRQRRS